MKHAFPSFPILLVVLLWSIPLDGQKTIPQVAPGPVAWEEMAKFLPDSLGGHEASSAAEGGRLEEEGMSVSWASRKYGVEPGPDGLEVTILDTRGASFALEEFHRLRLGREKSETKTVLPLTLRRCPAVQVNHHREQKAEVLILAGERLLVHVIASGLGEGREPAAVKAVWRGLDLKGLATLSAGLAAKND